MPTGFSREAIELLREVGAPNTNGRRILCAKKACAAERNRKVA